MRLSESSLHPLPTVAFWALVVLAMAGCDRESNSWRSPTAPETPASPVPTPTPTPGPPADVAGAWAGTMTVTWDEMEGGGSCSEPVTAKFTQVGAAVSGPLKDTVECYSSSPFWFDGTAEGDFLYGSLYYEGGGAWATTGRVEGERLTFTAFNVVWELRRQR